MRDLVWPGSRDAVWSLLAAAATHSEAEPEEAVLRAISALVEDYERCEVDQAGPVFRRLAAVLAEPPWTAASAGIWPNPGLDLLASEAAVAGALVRHRGRSTSPRGSSPVVPVLLHVSREALRAAAAEAATTTTLIACAALDPSFAGDVLAFARLVSKFADSGLSASQYIDACVRGLLAEPLLASTIWPLHRGPVLFALEALGSYPSAWLAGGAAPPIGLVTRVLSIEERLRPRFQDARQVYVVSEGMLGAVCAAFDAGEAAESVLRSYEDALAGTNSWLDLRRTARVFKHSPVLLRSTPPGSRSSGTEPAR